MPHKTDCLWHAWVKGTRVLPQYNIKYCGSSTSYRRYLFDGVSVEKQYVFYKPPNSTKELWPNYYCENGESNNIDIVFVLTCPRSIGVILLAGMSDKNLAQFCARPSTEPACHAPPGPSSPACPCSDNLHAGWRSSTDLNSSNLDRYGIFVVYSEVIMHLSEY